MSTKVRRTQRGEAAIEGFAAGDHAWRFARDAHDVHDDHDGS